jgi:hypothetical protein
VNSRSNFDFKKHTLPPVKRWYLVKIIIYVLLLTVLLVILYYRNSGAAQIEKETIEDAIEVEVETQKKPD